MEWDWVSGKGVMVGGGGGARFDECEMDERKSLIRLSGHILELIKWILERSRGSAKVYDSTSWECLMVAFKMVANATVSLCHSY